MRLPTTCAQLGYKLESLMTPSSGFINLLKQLTELRETLPYIYYFIEGWDTKEQPVGKIRRVRSGRAPYFCPCGITLPV